MVGQTTKIRGAAGRSIVTGELTAFYADDTLLDAFDTEAEVALVFTLTDGTNTCTFTLPKIKFTGGKPRSAASARSASACRSRRFTPRIAPRKSLSSGCLPDEII